MEKTLIDRRMAQMQSEGVEFRVNSHVGKNISIDSLNKNARQGKDPDDVSIGDLK